MSPTPVQEGCPWIAVTWGAAGPGCHSLPAQNKKALNSHWNMGQLSPGTGGVGWVGRDHPNSDPMPPAQDTELSIHPCHCTGERLRQVPAAEGN